jgi:sugar phosphate permease
MGLGMVALALVPASAPIWLLALLLIPVGITGPLAMQPTTTVLLDTVPAAHSGVASGVFNTSRQIGSALAVAVFGALIATNEDFVTGLRESLVIAAVVAFVAAGANLLPPSRSRPASTARTRSYRAAQ